MSPAEFLARETIRRAEEVKSIYARAQKDPELREAIRGASKDLQEAADRAVKRLNEERLRREKMTPEERARDYEEWLARAAASEVEEGCAIDRALRDGRTMVPPRLEERLDRRPRGPGDIRTAAGLSESESARPLMESPAAVPTSILPDDEDRSTPEGAPPIPGEMSAVLCSKCSKNEGVVNVVMGEKAAAKMGLAQGPGVYCDPCWDEALKLSWPGEPR